MLFYNDINQFLWDDDDFDNRLSSDEFLDALRS